MDIANRVSIEVFDEIAGYVNHQNPMQAIRKLLLGFFPLSRDQPTEIQQRYATPGSAKLRGSRHWGVFVLDTLHGCTARERIHAQLDQWRFLSSRAAGWTGSLRPLTLRFYNFDFSSGEHLAYFNLPRVELMAACVSFELFATRDDPASSPAASTWAAEDPPPSQRRRIMDIRNFDFHASVKNSPLRWLCLDTPTLLRLYIAARSRMYIDAGGENPCVAETFLPFSPRLKIIDVAGSINPQLFHLSRFPLLEHFAFDLDMPGSALNVLAECSPKLRFLRASLDSDPANDKLLFFPKLETIVATSGRLLNAVGGQPVTPRLSKIFVADNQTPERIASLTFGRDSIRLIGPWSGARPGEISRGVIDAVIANNKVMGQKSSITLILQDLSVSGVWSFIEAWIDEDQWPTVASIDVRNCRLTATTALALCDLAKVIVSSGGSVVFTSCRSIVTQGPYTICDSWAAAVMGEGKMRLAQQDVTLKIV